jgi:hypothetical protein
LRAKRQKKSCAFFDLRVPSGVLKSETMNKTVLVQKIKELEKENLELKIKSVFLASQVAELRKKLENQTLYL